MTRVKRERNATHPLRILFGWGQMTHDMGMNFLQDRGLISDLCVNAEEVADDDLEKVLRLAGARFNPECLNLLWNAWRRESSIKSKIAKITA